MERIIRINKDALENFIEYCDTMIVQESSVGKLNYYEDMDNNFTPKDALYIKDFDKIELTKENYKTVKKRFPKSFRFRFPINIKDNVREIVWFDSSKKMVASITVANRDNKIYLDDLFVETDYQGHGLSKQILDIAVKEYKAKYLETFSEGKIAQYVYEKYGFKKYKETTGVYHYKL